MDRTALGAFRWISQAAAGRDDPYGRPVGARPRRFCEQEQGCFCTSCADVPVGLLAFEAVLGKLFFRKALQAGNKSKYKQNRIWTITISARFQSLVCGRGPRAILKTHLTNTIQFLAE